MAEISDAGRRAIDAGMDPTEWDLRVQLACAFRTNAYLGWEDSINTHTSMRVHGPEHANTLNSIDNLAVLYQSQERYAEAEPLWLETLETRKRLLGDDHPATLGSMYNLACLAALRGNHEQAFDWLRRAIDTGFTDADWMKKDSDLESLHGPEFDSLVERARQSAAAQRAE